MIKKLIFVTSVLYVLVGAASATNDADSNAAEFREMCGFIGILRQRPEAPTLNEGEKPVQIREEAMRALKVIKILNVSTTDEDTYRSLEAGVSFDKVKGNPVIKELGSSAWEELLTFWKAEKDTGIQRPGERPVLTIIHEKIGKILNEAERVYGRIVKNEEAIKLNILSAHRDMVAAAFGQKGSPVGHDSGALDMDGEHAKLGVADAGADAFDQSDDSVYSKQCNGEGGGKVGENLAADLTCLCAAKSDTDNNKDMCVGSVGTISADLDGTGGALATWKALRPKCLDEIPKKVLEKPTPQSLHSIVSRHRAMLGKGAHFTAASAQGNYAKNSNFILGRHGIAANAAGAKCDGTLVTAAQKGICVNYGTVLKKGEEIPWIGKILKAAETLSVNERLYSLQFTLLSKIENLKAKAEMYYENSHESTATLTSSTAGLVEAKNRDQRQNGSNPLANGEGDFSRSREASKHQSKKTYAVGVFLLLLDY